jgi:RNA polymerase sigma-70 factor (ECF subfamily)
MQHFTDEQLIEIYQSNKDGQGQITFGHLYDRYARLMLNFFYFSLQYDHNKAQDFVHDLFVKIIEKHNTFDNNQLFKAWIYKIASNMCNNEFRKNNVIKKYQDHIKSSSEYILSDPYTEKDLRRCLNELIIEQRSIIILRFKLKFTIKEIAQIYECPEGTVKSRLFYAIKGLSKIYKTE